MNCDDELEIERSLFGFEDIEDIGGVMRELVKNNFNFFF